MFTLCVFLHKVLASMNKVSEFQDHGYVSEIQVDILFASSQTFRTFWRNMAVSFIYTALFPNY